MWNSQTWTGILRFVDPNAARLWLVGLGDVFDFFDGVIAPALEAGCASGDFFEQMQFDEAFAVRTEGEEELDV
jgi:hypothetical protein